ncbi:MAG: hypothetical protein HQL08_08815 [Nitrospirae bacterium]|nr:hypothetical protein [Nitrospirota bacterium]
MDWTLLKDFIKKRCGLSFEDTRTVALEEAVLKRMSDRGMGSLTVYYNYLCENGEEFDKLISLLTINETYFLREPVHFDLLVGRIVPELLARKKGDAIRIVCAGCSTGEEPYSIVMSLMDKYGAGMQRFVSVFGFDIDSNALSMAREGVYRGHSFRSVSEDFINKYFTRTQSGHYKIKDAVKQSVEFAEFNFLSESYPSEFQGVDVIFYRNVSIYFEPETQQAIFKTLAGLLNDDGYLIVSSTETLSHDCGVLSLIEMDGLFLYRKDMATGRGETRKADVFNSAKIVKKVPAPKKLTMPPVSSRKIDKPSGEKKRDNDRLFEEALEYARAKKYEDSLSCLDSLIEQAPAYIKAYTLKGSVLINMKRLDEAEAACLRSTEMDQLGLEGYLLLGLIAKMKGDDDTAARRFKEALYIRASCWLAHFYLAEIHRSRDEYVAACREYELVIKQLMKGPQQDDGLAFFPLAFSADQIVHLCNHNLARLRKMVTGAGSL